MLRLDEERLRTALKSPRSDSSIFIWLWILFDFAGTTPFGKAEFWENFNSKEEWIPNFPTYICFPSAMTLQSGGLFWIRNENVACRLMMDEVKRFQSGLEELSDIIAPIGLMARTIAHLETDPWEYQRAVQVMLGEQSAELFVKIGFRGGCIFAYWQAQSDNDTAQSARKLLSLYNDFKREKVTERPRTSTRPFFSLPIQTCGRLWARVVGRGCGRGRI